MRFYKIEGTIENKYRIKNSENRRAAREISDNIALLSRAFNEKRNGKSFMYVANILADRMTAGMICTEDTDTGRQTELFSRRSKQSRATFPRKKSPSIWRVRFCAPPTATVI